MDSLQQTPHAPKSEETGQAKATAISVRLWTYGGQQRKLRDYLWNPEGDLADFVDTLLHERSGTLVEASQNLLTLGFDTPFHALMAAKVLQQKLFDGGQDLAAERMVAAIAVHEQLSFGAAETGAESSLNGGMVPRRPLREADLPQILVTEGIYQIAKTGPEFQFNVDPKRRAGGSRGPERMYSLLWADEATYGRVRRAVDEANLPQFSRYVIESELGRGMMGAVYKAHDQTIDRMVALKTISVDSNAGSREENIERLRREAKAAGSLDHPNIITIYDVGQEESFFYLSMQFVEGKTLSAILDSGKALPLGTVLKYCDQICSAVGFAHKRGVVHRDLKPSNLMVTDQDNIKVLDFGIAKLESAGLTQIGMVVGTPCYMAPEQALGKKVDQRSDIFSLGAVFYELFTGKKAFGGQDVTSVLYKVVHEEPLPPAAVEPTLPIGIDTIIRRALGKNPQQRFQNCEELRAAFRAQARLLAPTSGTQETGSRVVDPAAIPQVLLTTTTRSRAVAARRKRRSGWITAFACLVVIALAAGFWTGRAKLKAKLQAQTAEASQTAQPQSPNTGQQTVVPAAGTAVPGTTTATDNGKPPTDPPTGNQGSPSDQAGTSAASGGNTATGGQPIPPSVSGTDAGKTAGAQNSSAANSGAAGSADPSPTSSTNTGGSSPATGIPASGTGATPAQPAADAPDSGNNAEAEEVAPPKNPKPKNAGPKSADVSAEGFHRSDIPSLMSKADAAAGRGDYAVAKYEYNIVLRLDRQNAGAKAGLRQVAAAEKAKRR